MFHLPSLLLHAGHGLGTTLFEYLYRVLLHLLAFGGLAALLLWGEAAATVVRSALGVGRGNEDSER